MPDSKQRVAILGASGYSALELVKLLLRHPQVEITALTTRQTEPRPVGEVHPSLRNRLDLALESLDAAAIAKRADYAFCCLPHGASAAAAKELLPLGVKLVDLSADYRLSDPTEYAKWYGLEHADHDNLKDAVYGLPELYRDDIREASLVANPGCYPTSAILALAPLLEAGVIAPEGIIIDSKSGVSGAGREPKPHLHFAECNENFAPYGVGTHRHMPEIDQILSDAAGMSVETIFTPHLVPMNRGILSTSYAVPTRDVTSDDLLAIYGEFYAEEPFVRVVTGLPATKNVSGTNFCDLTARVVRGRVLALSAIDNLIKGASGAAVQNFNLMCGIPETAALL